MQIVSNDFLTEQASSTPRAKSYFTINGTAQETYIVSIAVTQDLASGGQFSIGNFNSSSLTLQVFTQYVSIAVGDVLAPFFGFYVGDGSTYECVQKGVFTVPDTGIKQTGGYTEITAYDASYTMTGDYTCGVDFTDGNSHYADEIITDLETALSVTINVPTGITPSSILVLQAPTGTYREAVAYIAGLCGCNAIMSNTSASVIDFRKPTLQALALSASDYGQGGLTLESDSATPITCLETGGFLAPEGYSDAGIFVTFTSPDMGQQSDADALAGRVGITTNVSTTLSYRGFTLNTLKGYPQIDVGDIVPITDAFSVTTNLMVLNASYLFNGGITTSFSANVPLENKAKHTTLGELGQAAEKATEALNAVQNVSQYFWHTSSGADAGAHVTEIPKDQFEASPSGGNTLMRSDGVLLRDGLDNLAVFDTDGIHSYNPDGATFFDVDYDGGQMTTTDYDILDETEENFAFETTSKTLTATLDLTAQNGVVETASNPYITFEYPVYSSTTPTITLSNHEFWSTVSTVPLPSGTYIIIGTYLPNITIGTTASFSKSTTATFTLDGTSFSLTITFAYTSSSKQLTCTISGTTSSAMNHAFSKITRTARFTFPFTTNAPAYTLGSDGGDTKGQWSTRIGQGLAAQYENQLAVGAYNDNKEDNAFEIGNGTDDSDRSNAFTVDWDGKINGMMTVDDNGAYVTRDVTTNSSATARIRITDPANGNIVQMSANGNSGTTATISHGIWSSIQSRWLVSGYNGKLYLGGTVFNDLFQVSTGAVTISSITANGYNSATGNAVNKSGYYPIGIVGYDITGTGSGSIPPVKFYLTSISNGTCKVFAGLHNDSSTARTNITFTAYILWVKII